MINARAAQAIRFGIKQARKTRYGSVDDPFYKLRSEVIWKYFREARLSDLCKRAFDRTWARLVREAEASMTPQEQVNADEAFRVSYDRWRETPQQKEFRLLKEEVQRLRAEVRQKQ